MAKNKSKAVHAIKIKHSAPFSQKIKKKEQKGQKQRRVGGFKSLAKFDVSRIKNKEKRIQILERKQNEQKKTKKMEKKEKEANPDREKLDPLTIDDKREIDENFVFDEDDQEELQNEELIDEFQNYFQEGQDPKIIITTSERPSRQLFDFLKDVKDVFGPETHYWPRKQFSIKEIQEYSINKGYTELLIFREHRKEVSQLIYIHLPKGPTYKFKLTNYTPCDEIHHHGRFTDHNPELILNHFNTKVGRRVGRGLAALFPSKPQFRGRRVVTFHNQRDFIFFRHHRYMFQEEGQKVALQELGPRFTLQLKQLKLGLFNDDGEIEFEARDDYYVKRTAAFL
ncbi:unnamed protein product [Paramecium pentaurelia]|uniref:Brix domain-containing protein n=1 Tax=Paramecium pentaurelia TaxID=43138 RepID=A0A8S1SZN2_9CILI|nr:unnamed protein product [Paramecium pentaurelia]